MSTREIKILLAEDDINLDSLLKEYLEAKNYSVELAKNGKIGYDMFCKQSYDLCLFDVMMPLKDGFTLAKEIRIINKDIPIIFLTAKSLKEDTIEGFYAGADDYITKPFSMEELLKRVQAVLRRTKKIEVTEKDKKEFVIGKYIFNTQTQKLICGNITLKLTTKEVQLLRLLALNINQVVDRSYTLNTIWQQDDYFTSRSMDVYLSKLRKYLKHDEKVEIINLHGKGFKLLVNS